jgi:hypothetical protein
LNPPKTPQCLWTAPEDPDEITDVTVILWTSHDLNSAAYPKLKQHSFFIPGTVMGYPSVDLNIKADINPWKCMTYVGISDKQSITVMVMDPHDGNYCPKAHQVTEAVLKHLQKQ